MSVIILAKFNSLDKKKLNVNVKFGVNRCQNHMASEKQFIQ